MAQEAFDRWESFLSTTPPVRSSWGILGDSRGQATIAVPNVWVCLYGSDRNFGVLREVDLVSEPWEVVRLDGFDIRIRPHANIVHSDRHCVYEIVATASHAELARLYAHARDVPGEVDLPEAVLVRTLAGPWRPALGYIWTERAPRPADDAYLERIIGPARERGFPMWYVARLERFRA